MNKKALNKKWLTQQPFFIFFFIFLVLVLSFIRGLMVYAKIQPLSVIVFMPWVVHSTCRVFGPLNSYSYYSRVFRQRPRASRRAVWNERQTNYTMYKGEFLREAPIGIVVVGDKWSSSPFCVVMRTVLWILLLFRVGLLRLLLSG